MRDIVFLRLGAIRCLFNVGAISHSFSITPLFSNLSTAVPTPKIRGLRRQKKIVLRTSPKTCCDTGFSHEKPRRSWSRTFFSSFSIQNSLLPVEHFMLRRHPSHKKPSVSIHGGSCF